MRKCVATAAIVAACIFGPLSRAQKATEMFIPIGESPGVSGETSVIGTIESVDHDRDVVMVRSGSDVHRVELTDATRIWIDRSGQRRTNYRGTHADCEKDRLCEVKFVYDDGTRTARAEWIKIRPEP